MEKIYLNGLCYEINESESVFLPLARSTKAIVGDGFEVDLECLGINDLYGRFCFKINKITKTVVDIEEVEVIPHEEEKEESVDFSKMTKKQLVEYINENKLDIDTSMTKAKILEALK